MEGYCECRTCTFELVDGQAMDMCDMAWEVLGLWRSRSKATEAERERTGLNLPRLPSEQPVIKTVRLSEGMLKQHSGAVRESLDVHSLGR